MKQSSVLAYFITFFAISSLCGQACAAQEPTLRSAGAPYAPLDVSKKYADSNVALSESQRNELLGEFKGLVHIGMRPVAYGQWKAKDMADCDQPQKREDRWSYRCEIITGQGNGYYYFYPSASHSEPTLQELDVQVHSADERLLDDFRRPVQDMFGRATFVERPRVYAKTSGPIRRWSADRDTAELFIDHTVRPEGSVRFIWTRDALTPH